MTMILVVPRLMMAVLVATSVHFAVESISAEAVDPSGTWLTEDGRARVRTERCGPGNKHLCGYVVWSGTTTASEDPRIDAENPDARKRNRPVLGHQMILGLKLDENDRYGGKIYSADDGKQYDVTIRSERSGELLVEGCMLAVLCGTQTWRRVADVLPGQLHGLTDESNGPRADREWAPKRPSTAGGPTLEARAAPEPRR
ncbi:MAG: DUF2147 domain-containing protein [Methylobacterium sp.]|uniref:DUF2147 domain-containing protein n=1 Tax=unclassified Methylobacterium TaxID=2615210 RepID=UPI0011CA671E|nr:MULTISPECIES: DUF2147 domain-containing protein [unclassified Methylobacterium]MDO9425672.1 DUF2147 domain-containing protein [Methylobacterium sp.]TXM78434.1 DUF2147 domain-containing protein [Methylobacterium sp. WL69]